MTEIEKLHGEYEKAERAAHALMAEKDEHLQKVLDRYRDKLQQANQDAADAQKALCDAEAAAALVGRDDAETVAENLGLTLPEDD